jgi:cyclophilin family peptidyl-prolyl cis-trans isomerase
MLSIRSCLAVVGTLVCSAGLPSPALAATSPRDARTGAGSPPFISQFTTTATLASTVPPNGDQNPYGIVTAPRTIGCLHAGDILVSNFNNEGPTVDGMPSGGGNQGQGTTIVQFNADGSSPRVFAQISSDEFPGGVGLTTALAALPDGYVVVGSLPTTDGTSATMTAGGLLVLSPCGTVVGEISGGAINGPWDMTSVSRGPFTTLFVTNVLNGTVAASPATVDQGTVVRIVLFTGFGAPLLLSEHVIATGFAERTDPAALVVGPTGVGLGQNGTLYVADAVSSRIAAIPDAMMRLGAVGGGGLTVSTGGDLNDPLGLVIAPNGDILSATGGDGNLVETTPAGVQVAEQLIDDNNGNGAGDLFGIDVAAHGSGAVRRRLRQHAAAAQLTRSGARSLYLWSVRPLRATTSAALAALAVAGCGSSGGAGSAHRVAATAHVTSGIALTAHVAAAHSPCTKVATPKPKPIQHLRAPTLRLDPAKTYTVTVVTNCGSFAIALDVRQSPKTSASVYSLVKRGFYDDLTFHRVAAGFVIQGGDPQGNGTGGPGYTVVEAPPKGTEYVEGDVAMAKTQSQPSGASGSQFFIVLPANAGLAPQYALLGKVVSGLAVVEAIGRLPTKPAGDGYPTPAVVMSKVTVAAS